MAEADCGCLGGGIHRLDVRGPAGESHLHALEITHAVTLLRPFHGGGQNEIVRQPKVYAFDTGFVSWARGWEPLRPEDCGLLWEHVVLEHLQAYFPDTPVCYWRDKQGREVDFVLARGRDEVDVIECKWNSDAFEGEALQAFRRYYPKGRNYLLSPLGSPGTRNTSVPWRCAFARPRNSPIGCETPRSPVGPTRMRRCCASCPRTGLGTCLWGPQRVSVGHPPVEIRIARFYTKTRVPAGTHGFCRRDSLPPHTRRTLILGFRPRASALRVRPRAAHSIHPAKH